MHVHILGICGTFMGGIALIARELGHRVTGSDANVYPPMSTQLASSGITLYDGYAAGNLAPRPDLVVIGNALSRGNPEVEAVLDSGIPYTSGAQWLSEHVLYRDRWTLAVAGTHGKTTTSSMLAWILQSAGLAPGFLIGGVAANFGVSARLGGGAFFVVEADEYDTAFFDKRSKFVHYRPRTLVLNNLEFDHADIFADLAAIERQFHHLVRTVPASGLILANREDANVQAVLDMGCWSALEYFGDSQSWWAQPLNDDASRFRVHFGDRALGDVEWSLIGIHNMMNGLAALAAARHAGVPVNAGIDALRQFDGVRRRLERRGTEGDVTVYDDFAHHPTAIRATIAAMRARVGDRRIVAVLEPRSNTMRMGVHRDELAESLSGADQVYLVRPAGLGWDLGTIVDALGGAARVFDGVDEAVTALLTALRPGDHVVVMSNGGFGNIHEKLLTGLRAR